MIWANQSLAPINPIHRIHPSNRLRQQAEDAQFCLGTSYYMPLARSMWSLFSYEQRSRVACILPPANYICYLLTGVACVPIPEHYAKFYWPCTVGHPLDHDFCHLLPKLRQLSECVGYVQASHALGSLLQGAPVFCPGSGFFLLQKWGSTAVAIAYCAIALVHLKVLT